MSERGRRALAEAVGSFMLVLAGCGAIMVNHTTGLLGHSGVAAVFGLVIMAMIAALGHISGAHFNPAVTIAFASIRHLAWRDVPVYVAGQVGGATLAALVLRTLLGPIANLGATLPTLAAPQAWGVEVLLTAGLMFVITAVATDHRAAGQLAAIAIGGTVALSAGWAGPLTGASMNPARSFGPALVANVWQDHWLYWLGPVVGAVIGAHLYQLTREPKHLRKEAKNQ